MKILKNKIPKAQGWLQGQSIDGWLLYDFCKNNNLACSFLEIANNTNLTRRFFYWIPAKGTPVKILSAAEANVLNFLPGKTITYRTWKELEKVLATLLEGSKTIAMEYSPKNAVPDVSKVDAGTMEMVREVGVTVVSSADLLQQHTSVWDEEKLRLHLMAAQCVERTVAGAWNYIAHRIQSKRPVTEFDVQQWIIAEFQNKGMVWEANPICAVNAHSADPHYAPIETSSQIIARGDFILIDLWCKKDKPRATYADITRVGVASETPSEKQRKIFNIVKRAQDTATAFVKKRMASGQSLMGWEVDQACRDVIEASGFGPYFIHRTGHNIDESDHGVGAHIDNFETQEMRQILPGTCFSIEPGIYLPGAFGIRLEYNVYVHHDRTVQVTGGIQKEIHCLF